MVLIGLGGLTARDVSAARTPALARLLDTGSSAALVVRGARGHTCPLDGWLSLSASDGAAGPEDCSPPAPPRATAIEEGTPPRYVVPGWSRLVDAQRSTGFGAHIGLLGETLADSGVCATAVGPGAAVALADARGRVGSYVPAFDARTRPADVVARCPLTVVDAGTLLTDDPRERAAAVARTDRLVARVRVEAASATVIVAGISDEPAASGEPAASNQPAASGASALRFAAMAGPGVERGWLTSGSTRSDALVRLMDLTPTLTHRSGAGADPRFVGAPWRTVASTDPALATLTGFDTVNDVVRRGTTWLFAAAVGLQLFGYGIALVVVARTRGRRHPSRPRRIATRIALAAALVTAAVPCAAFVVGLVPWERTGAPGWTLGLGLAGLAVVLALGVARLPTVPVWTATTALAAATCVVLAANVVSGSHLQGRNLITPGDLPIVGGRFFGFGNVGFAVFAATALVAASGLAAWFAERGHRRAAALVVLGLGSVAVVVDGWPGWGADFGGVLALVPAFAVLAAGIAGVRMTVRRVLLVGLATVAAVTAVAVADWLRPPDRRSHLGTFVQRVLDGEALPVVVRKAEMALSTVTYGGVLGWCCVAAYAGAALLVLRPRLVRADGLVLAFRRWPTLEPTLRAVLVLGVVGFVLNDSGIAVPATLVVWTVPLVVVAVLRAADGARTAAPSASTPSASTPAASTESAPAVEPSTASVREEV